jgi:hypothetical protein
MGAASSDRARMRTDLRELAKLAVPDSSPTSHAFETADSSGYVDLSAFSATDDSWVERELARAGGRAKGGATLAAGSMAPVAMSSLLDAEPADTGAASRKRGWVYTGLGLAGTAVVAILAVAVARHAPPSTKNAAHGEPAVAAQPALAPATPPAAPGPVTSAATPPIDVMVSAPDNAPASKKHEAAHWRGASAAAVTPTAPVAAATRPAQAATPAKVTLPPPKSGGGGGDSLIDLMRASINAPKKVH